MAKARRLLGYSHGVSSRGRKVTVAVICLMTERISSWMVLMDFSLGALGNTGELTLSKVLCTNTH